MCYVVKSNACSKDAYNSFLETGQLEQIMHAQVVQQYSEDTFLQRLNLTIRFRIY